MMAREWQPGELGVCEGAACDGVRVIRTEDEWWEVATGDRHTSVFADPNVRPLVVLDPESREDAARLTALFRLNGGGEYAGVTAETVAHQDDAMQKALRAMVEPPKPPKPEEPKGVGAVVVDGDGKLYIRVEPGKDRAPWIVESPHVDNPRPYRFWDGIDAVDVLSDGVPTTEGGA